MPCARCSSYQLKRFSISILLQFYAIKFHFFADHPLPRLLFGITPCGLPSGLDFLVVAAASCFFGPPRFFLLPFSSFSQGLTILFSIAAYVIRISFCCSTTVAPSTMPPPSTPPPHHWVSCCQKNCKIIFVIPIDDDVFQIYFVVQFRKNMCCGNKLRRCCCERADLQRHAHGNVALSVRSLHFSTDHFSTILFIVVLLFVCISKFDIFTCHYGSKLSAIPPHLLVAQQQCCC